MKYPVRNRCIRVQPAPCLAVGHRSPMPGYDVHPLPKGVPIELLLEAARRRTRRLRGCCYIVLDDERALRVPCEGPEEWTPVPWGWLFIHRARWDGVRDGPRGRIRDPGATSSRARNA